VAGKRRDHLDTFWSEALAVEGAVSRQVTREVLIFTAFALGVSLLDYWIHPTIVVLGVDVTPYEVAGAALGLLLVLRTNAGYERWWEARKLWGGVVNQSRALAVSALANGPDDPHWRSQLVRWTAAFAHTTRRTLRGQRELPEVAALLGDDEAGRLAAARHMPTAVSMRLAALLREARERPGAEPLALVPAELARNQLLDHLGGCERIVKTPLPRVYGIHIRRFLLLFLLTLPFGLLAKFGFSGGVDWLTPLVTMLVAYPLLALDQVGFELQNPFDTSNLGHLPLDDICATIEGDLLALAPGGDAGSIGSSTCVGSGEGATGSSADPCGEAPAAAHGFAVSDRPNHPWREG
jgi:putative membrane protein